ncbi:hypothetical protein V5799_031221 [Amblyomma americanum]|uniref:Uncharacterized protein n=1 Tax=Amblyomma americanum TaxID=6943 RepID=A0AAQ4EL05_AMBAM
MANSLEEFDHFMAQGVNAIEADVAFAPNATALMFYHGPGCDYGRDCERETRIDEYLSYVKDAVSAEGGKHSDKMLLFYLDIKTENLRGRQAKYNAGVSLALNLMQHLWSQGKPTILCLR